MNRVKNILNSVQNTENSTGNAQYQILKSPQPGKTKMQGPYMNTALNWSNLKNDPRLSAAQKKTINKILVSLQIPARDIYRNRPRINFDPKNMTIPQINSKLRKAVAIRAASGAGPARQSTNRVKKAGNVPPSAPARPIVSTYGF